jgi:hypothetical protein
MQGPRIQQHLYMIPDMNKHDLELIGNDKDVSEHAEKCDFHTLA